MTDIIVEPNEELAIILLAAGQDEKALRELAGFPSVRAARAFANRPDIKAEVTRAVDARGTRVGVKGLATLEQILDSPSTDGRTRVAAVRTALEFAGHLRRGSRASVEDQYRGLSVEELRVLIDQTRAELGGRMANVSGQPPALSASLTPASEEGFNAR